MKTLAITILSFICLAQASAASAEYLQGTVVRVDRDRGEFAMRFSADSRCGLETDKGERDRQGSPPPEDQGLITVRVARFPGCLVEGAQVSVRGAFVAGQPALFQAEDVFSCRRRGGHDPTGVRSRFHDHRRRMMEERMGGGRHEK